MLTNRLQAVANMVEKGVSVADIGTDHAYVPLYLVQNDLVSRAICSDVKEGPCKIARENIREQGLQNIIEVRCGSGLSVLRPYEVNTAVIAGMGGELIASILSDDSSIAKSIRKFVLQPMTALDELRLYLYQNGYHIENEVLAKEKNKYYVIMDVIHQAVKVPEPEYLYIGKKLIENHDPLLEGYLLHKIDLYESALKGMQLSSRKLEEKEKYRYLLTKFKFILENTRNK